MNKKIREQLVQKAMEAAANSYAPYSKFHVGAALLAAAQPAGIPRRKRSGSIADRQHVIISGANIENASYGLTICAERAALASAITAGYRRFKAIAVVVSGKKPVGPCGACLQALAEFCRPDLIVLVAAAARPDKIIIYKLRDLLPHTFRFRP